ncbi:unnamed protein product [Trichogramma brassicae]|uniref:Uncharacterized protein n=1 Tax=Trichogramma brassicae TaxID=86971 RepID=A0A6H5I053_9HYME|nr:unnamed protein product [Trichogramma brassicae]
MLPAVPGGNNFHHLFCWAWRRQSRVLGAYSPAIPMGPVPRSAQETSTSSSSWSLFTRWIERDTFTQTNALTIRKHLTRKSVLVRYLCPCDDDFSAEPICSICLVKY